MMRTASNSIPQSQATLPNFYRARGGWGLSLLWLVGCSASTPRLTTAAAPAKMNSATDAPETNPVLSLGETGIEPSWMDQSADPCVDYFAYACGGFEKTQEIPPDRSSWGTTQLIQRGNDEFFHVTLENLAARSLGAPATLNDDERKLGDFYGACMDEASIEQKGAVPVQEKIEAVNRALPDGAAVAARLHTLSNSLLPRLHREGVDVLFGLGPTQDYNDSTQVILGFDQDGIGLPDRDYYLKNEGNQKEIREFYRGHIARMLMLLGRKPGEAKKQADLVVNFETELAKIQQDKVVRRDPHKIYHPLNREQLERLGGAISWGSYLGALGLADVKAFTVNDPNYFTALASLIKKEKPATLRAYFTFHLAAAYADSLSSAFVNERFSMRKKITGQKELPPRWKRCARATDGALGEILAKPYLSDRFAGDSKELATRLVLQIQAAMRFDLSHLVWMDDETRARALGKLEGLKHKVGYPDKLRQYDFKVDRSSFLNNEVAAGAFEFARQVKKIGQPVDRNEWQMTPPTVNAYYDPSLNEIVIPAGELQPPFFSRTFYAPVNIGDEGANTIGHEITHGFDDEGSQFDAQGNLANWWKPDTKAKFETATQCVKDQYSSYEAIPGVKLNGALTAGENIADIGGVKLGYIALKDWQTAHPEERRTVTGFSDEQLYFLAYSQGWCEKNTKEALEVLARTNPHVPGRYRVNGVMAASPAFGDAYQCAVGAPMRPKKACEVW